MKPEVILVAFLGAVSLLIVVANDWWKRRLVEKAEEKGKKVRKDLYVNKTRCGMVAIVALGLGVMYIP